jgi:rare lipoprotein A
VTIGLAAGVVLLAGVTPAFAIKPQASTATSGSLHGHAGRLQKSHPPRRAKVGHALRGTASFYRLRGPTSSGEALRDNALTAAHRTLPFNTRVKVKCATTGKSVVVRINDRGPFVRGRIIDVSYGAAKMLGLHGRGLTRVTLEVLK